MRQRISHLVVDSGAFIRNASVHEYADNVYTVDGAVKEIKDKATLQRLQFLPYELRVKTAEPECYKHVVEFSKKTGDYSSLSATDLQIIALTYQLEKEHVGTDHLRTTPTCQVTGRTSGDFQPLEGFYYPRETKSSVSSDDNQDSADNSALSETSDAACSEGKESKDFEEPDDRTELSGDRVDTSPEGEPGHDDSLDADVSDDESWITPENLTEVQKKMGSLTLDTSSDIKVACVTTDFAVQNVLLQMGLNVVSVDGILIKHIKVFILRCYACFKTTADMTRQFCPNCGNKTLKRVSVSVNEDGSKNIHVNFRKPIKIRGTKYSLPMPRGGKHPNNPVLCEDQPLPHNRPAKAALNKVDVFSPDYVVNTSPFAIRDVYSRAAGLGVYALGQKHGRRNPNEWSVRTGNKKKNKK